MCGGHNINRGSSKTTSDKYRISGSAASSDTRISNPYILIARSAWLRVIRRNASLPPHASRVAGELADLPSWTANGHAWPSLGWLAEQLSISQKVVRAALSRLAEAGFLSITERPGQTSIYQMSIVQEETDTVKDPYPVGEGCAATSSKPLPTKAEDPYPPGQGSNLDEKIYIPPISPSPKAEQGVDDFTEFLSYFPKTLPERMNVASTRRAYDQAVADGVEPAAVLAGARYYARICTGRDPRYVASPRKWLADARWREAPQLPATQPLVRPTAPVDELTSAVECAIHGDNRGGWVFVPEGSTAWWAWNAAFSHAGRPFAAGSLKVGKGRGRSFPTEFPPIPTISSSMKGNQNEHRDLH
ncbi:hypothetical protein [Castellaniella sp.]|uniref:hypothetical protein n=1 Tax=Castellaniella sp. TaxID=1955812 RepID=UPI003A5990A6